MTRRFISFQRGLRGLAAVALLSQPLSAGVVDSLLLDKSLEQTSVEKPRGTALGLLVPAQTDVPARQIAYFGYKAIEGGKFESVVLLYEAPPLEEAGGVLPASDTLETPHGVWAVDTDLRDRLAAAGDLFRLSNGPHAWSETVRFHLNLLSRFTAKRRPRVLPLAVAASNLETTKDLAAALMTALGAGKPGQTLVVIAENLSRGQEIATALQSDSQILNHLQTMAGDKLLVFLEGNGGGALGHGALLTGVFTLNGLLAASGHTLVYGNSGQFPLAKKDARQKSVGMAAVLFTTAATEPQKIAKDASQDTAKRITPHLFQSLMAAARAAVAHAMDPSAPAPKPAGDKRARESHRVFMSLYRKDVVAGRSGELLIPGPLEESVKFHAVQAALHDPWRAPITLEEWPSLSLTISLPAAPRKAGIRDILPGRDGVSLRYRNRENVFLPDAWKFLPHPAVFLAELAAQMRLEPWRWRADGAQILAFQVKTVTEGEVKDLPPPEPPQKSKPAEEAAPAAFSAPF